MKINEFKVKKVDRFIVTHYHENREHGIKLSQQYGEFANINQAEQVAIALAARHQGSKIHPTPKLETALEPKKRTIPLRNDVYFSLAQAQQLVDMFGGEDGLVSVQYIKDGPDGSGLYAHYTDYPEEGYAFLGE